LKLCLYDSVSRYGRYLTCGWCHNFADLSDDIEFRVWTVRVFTLVEVE
jgi:hypothetical protein